jgi:hypothetical protein
MVLLYSIPMGWTYESEFGNEAHEGYVLPEFDNGERGVGWSGGDIPKGAIAVEMRPDGSFRARPAGEVIGWRVVCDCYQEGRSGHETWVSSHLWIRVPSRVLQDLAAYKVYAVDDDVVDIGHGGDAIEDAVRAMWYRDHIDAIDAGAAIQNAVASVRAAEASLDAAVQAARHRGLAWAKVGAAAGMTAQSAHERWARQTEIASPVPRAK